jgi:hypothetical protein
MLNGCEFVKCEYWDGTACTDPTEYINSDGRMVCGRRDDAVATLANDTEAYEQMREAITTWLQLTLPIGPNQAEQTATELFTLHFGPHRLAVVTDGGLPENPFEPSEPGE